MMTPKIYLRKKKNSKGLYPIVMRLIKNRKSKIITIMPECKIEDWDIEKQQFKGRENQKKNRKLRDLLNKAEDVIHTFILNGIDFTLDEFEEKFLGKNTKEVTVHDYFDKNIEHLQESEQFGPAEIYLNTKEVLFKFAKKDLLFRQITPDFLRKYELYLRKRGNTDGGIAFKMRDIRTLFNDAVIDGIVSYDHYPFRKYKLSKLKGENRKIALTEAEFQAFQDVNLNDSMNLQDSHKIFLFSYYTRGMNFTDIMLLRWENVKGNKIHYTRSKTKKRLVIKILEPVQKILNHFKNRTNGTGYIFPILLKENMTPKQIHNRKHKTLRKFNQDLKEIGRLANIKQTLTSYVARHSFATHMKQKNTSIAVISELMGHSSVNVTMSYLKDFEDDFLDKETEKLLEEPENYYSRAS